MLLAWPPTKLVKSFNTCSIAWFIALTPPSGVSLSKATLVASQLRHSSFRPHKVNRSARLTPPDATATRFGAEIDILVEQVKHNLTLLEARDLATPLFRVISVQLTGVSGFYSI